MLYIREVFKSTNMQKHFGKSARMLHLNTASWHVILLVFDEIIHVQLISSHTQRFFTQLQISILVLLKNGVLRIQKNHNHNTNSKI